MSYVRMCQVPKLFNILKYKVFGVFVLFATWVAFSPKKNMHLRKISARWETKDG